MEITYTIKGVTLNVEELTAIYEYYRQATIADYIQFNYDCIDTDQKAMEVAREVIKMMDTYGSSEGEAIYYVIERYKNNK